MTFRDLRADEIDVRLQSVKQNGLVLLLYKDARCDMNILDETVGAENWQREHYECKGNLFCKVGINVIITYQKVPENGYGNQIAALKVIQKHKKARQATVLNAPVLTGE